MNKPNKHEVAEETREKTEKKSTAAALVGTSVGSTISQYWVYIFIPFSLYIIFELFSFFGNIKPVYFCLCQIKSLRLV